MNWEAIGAMGEIIGAITVVATVAYLAVQVRTAARATAIESKVATSRAYCDYLGQLIQSPDLNSLFLRGREDLAPLESEEYFRFSNLAFQGFSMFSAAHFQYRESVLNESDWYEHRAIVKFWLRGAGVRQWWSKAGQHMFGPDFAKYIESEIEHLEASQEALD